MREDELQHYGVIGMKWGVRRNPSKAYARAMVKKKKIDDKIPKIKVKQKALQVKASKKKMKAIKRGNVEKYVKAEKMALKAARKDMDIAKLERKGHKWMNKVDNTFKEYTVKQLKNENVKAGKSYVYRKIYGNDQYKVTKNTE